jgi:hypothetical protein
MKPNARTKGKIEHATGDQLWPANADATLAETLADVANRLAFRPELHRPPAGDYWFLIPFTPPQLEEAKALAILLSHRLPDLYFTLGRLLVHNGHFLRRQYGYKLRLVPATNVHLKREIHAALKGLT